MNKISVKSIIYGILALAFSGLIILLLYQSALPNAYSLAVGDKAPEDIVSTRLLVDKVKTEQRAVEQANQVPEVFLRSDEVSQASIERLEFFFDQLDMARERIKPLPNTDQASPSPVPEGERARQSIDQAAGQVVDEVRNRYGIEMNYTDVLNIIGLHDNIYQLVKERSLDMGRSLMADEQDSYGLVVNISTKVNELVQTNKLYRQELGSIASILRAFLEPNMLPDREASRAAKETAIQQVWANPTRIPTGTVLVKSGETINQTQYDLLVESDLIRTGSVNWSMLLPIVGLYIFALLLVYLYFTQYEKKQLRKEKDWLIILMTIVIVVLAAAYIRTIHPLLIPLSFVAIIISTYYGLRTSLLFTVLLTLLLYPLSGLDPKFLFVMILATWTSALVAASQSKKRDYLIIMLSTTLAHSLASLLYSTMLQEPTEMLVDSLIYSTVGGALSALLAVGLSPFYEVVLSQVSPTKLIRLSEPSQPLLRKLFLEAPGTHQHSMMIANLAETAAEKIGADALLVRVGAYYHDVGKTWNPQMYTENQAGFNPHTLLTTEESVRAIMRHVSAGEELAKRYRLPQEITDFMLTHHGTTVLQYFYVQAGKEAEAKGLPPPDPKDFTYPGKKPNSKETGIFMLADTVEAAMKSSGFTHVDDAEKLIRKLVRGKIDQDQLVESGLSFQDVEDIIQAFLQVYAGQFHERIKYPDANPVSK